MVVMVKTNAERQAGYRLRQKELGGKKRLNIWLSAHAHGKLGELVKQKGMSQQMFIEWLLTHNDLGQEVLGEKEREIVSMDEVTLLRNDTLNERGVKPALKKVRIAKLPGNALVDVGGSGKQSDFLVEQKLELSSQLELQI